MSRAHIVAFVVAVAAVAAANTEVAAAAAAAVDIDRDGSLLAMDAWSPCCRFWSEAAVCRRRTERLKSGSTFPFMCAQNPWCGVGRINVLVCIQNGCPISLGLNPYNSCIWLLWGMKLYWFNSKLVLVELCSTRSYLQQNPEICLRDFHSLSAIRLKRCNGPSAVADSVSRRREPSISKDALSRSSNGKRPYRSFWAKQREDLYKVQLHKSSLLSKPGEQIHLLFSASLKYVSLLGTALSVRDCSSARTQLMVA